jgi:hypothetical protein
MENLRKKNETEMQNKVEVQSSRIEQAEDRISELKGEMVIKGKTKELLVQQLKTCEKKTIGLIWADLAQGCLWEHNVLSARTY